MEVWRMLKRVSYIKTQNASELFLIPWRKIGAWSLSVFKMIQGSQGFSDTSKEYPKTRGYWLLEMKLTSSDECPKLNVWIVKTVALVIKRHKGESLSFYWLHHISLSQPCPNPQHRHQESQCLDQFQIFAKHRQIMSDAKDICLISAMMIGKPEVVKISYL